MNGSSIFRQSLFGPRGPRHRILKIVLRPRGMKSARVIGTDKASRKRRDDMGFQDGWGKSLDQLVAHMKEIPQ
jgi:uncharacterized protein YndB with AHSA1/START domain